MSELRHLFALMVSSQRKYVDPSKAVDILKEAFAATAATGVGDSQQVNNRLLFLLQMLEMPTGINIVVSCYRFGRPFQFMSCYNIQWNL